MFPPITAPPWSRQFRSDDLGEVRAFIGNRDGPHSRVVHGDRPLGYAMFQAPLVPGTLPANDGGVPQVVGMYLYSQGIILVELTAVLLLVALLGALLLARRPKEEHA